jgi:dienelactone hydrolase
VPLCAVLAVALGGVGALQLWRLDDLTTRSITVDGVPLLEVASTNPGDAGVVVAHGFAGSGRLMLGFADTLARRGYVVVLPDLSGHGANERRLSTTDGVAFDIDVAVRYLRTTHALPLSRIALVGHSMGAGAVTSYAVAHAQITATVAISLGTADDVPHDPAVPRNLLLVVGGGEMDRFRAAAAEALRRGYPEARTGQIMGDPRLGTARRESVVPATEHITVLFADQTHVETARWLDAAFGRPPVPVEPRPRDRLGPAGLVVLGFLIGIVPLSALLARWTTPREPDSEPPLGPVRPPRWSFVVGGGLVGCCVAVAGAQYLPTDDLPLAVGGYAAGFFAVVGLVLLAAWALDRPDGRRTTAPRLVSPGPVGPRLVGPRTATAALVLTGYAVTAIAVPTHLGFTNAVPTGDRWWLLVVLLGSVGMLLLGTELTAGRRWWARALILAATSAATLGAALLGTGPSFVVLVFPLLAILFAWHVAWASVLARSGAPAWLAAIVGAALVAWPIATTMPLMT